MGMRTARHSFDRKILSLDGLLIRRQQARRANKTVVHCHGCFDIVHPGHVRYLQFARQQGDMLIVSLTGDPHVGKGEGRPYVPQELRAENLAALEFVDYVYINPEPTAVNLLEALEPDIYIKGREYEHNNHPGFLKEKQTVEKHGGRVIFSSGDVVFSSSHIIENYASQIDLEQEKLALYCKRYDINRDILNDHLEQIVDRPYVVIGDIVLDRYQYCDAADLAPDAAMMSLTPLEHRDFFGGAAIIAQHLAGMGADVTLLTSLGSDEHSERALDALKSAGVDVLAMRNRRKIATKTRFVVESQKLFLLDESPATPTDSTHEKWLLEQLTRLSGNDATLMFYDAGLGLLTDTLAAQILEQYRSSFGKIIGGVAGRGKLSRLPGADLMIASERPLRFTMHDYEQGLSSVAYRFMTVLHTGALLVPSGKKGLLCFDQAKISAPGEAWEGKLRSEYLANPTNGVIDKLGTDEALLAITGGMLGAGASVHQAAYVGLAAGIQESRAVGHTPLDGHTISQCLIGRTELGDTPFAASNPQQ